MSQRRGPVGRLTVLHLSQPVEGGVARVVTDLARAQMRQGLRVVVACPREGSLPRSIAALGAEVRHWAAERGPGRSVPAETWTAHRLIGRVGPDVVHAHSAKAGLAGRLALRGRLPTVYQPHAWSFAAVEGPTARLVLAWERYAARWADRVLCVSDEERRTGERCGIRAAWTVVPNGVDLDAFPTFPIASPAEESSARQRAACRKSLPALSGVPAEAPLVVCVGRLCRQKGQRDLLRAWRRIAEQVPDAWLVFVGDGPDRPALTRQPHSRVRFAGGVADPSRWYAAADLVVQPSLWEGMALTPLEAMACGRPVVLTDVGGGRECLPPGQELECLVPPGDPDALATAVAGLLRAPRLRAYLGEAAQKHVRAEFDVQRTTSAVRRLYGELLDAGAHTTEKWTAR